MCRRTACNEFPAVQSWQCLTIPYRLEQEMKKTPQIVVALLAALSAQVASANTLPPNVVPEPGVLGLVGVAIAAAVYFGKRRK